MVFGHYSGQKAPHLDDHGHIVDPNRPGAYDTGPMDPSVISDPTHPEYDPGIDPNLQLRTVRTAAESIAESHRSEARREHRSKAKRKASLIGKRLGRGMTLNRGRTTRGRKPGAAGIAELVQDELGKFRDGHDGEATRTGATGTGGEGVGVAFDSAQQDETPFSATADVEEAAEQASKDEYTSAGSSLDQGVKKGKQKPAKRRNVYLNIAPTSLQEVDKKGEPLARYPRNKVRTSKYTAVTFLPRFLSEQFRRLANVYFLFLVLLQTSTLFGATVPQIAMLPLVAILGITAIKDSIEDYRRHILDNQVNNSAVTRLGNWRNVNQPLDSRTWFEKLTSRGGSNKVSKGVKKLREKEDAIGMGPIRGTSNREPKEEIYSGGSGLGRISSTRTGTDSLISGPGRHLETIMSESEQGASTVKLDASRMGSTNALLDQSTTTLDPPSRVSLPDSQGAVDYRRNTPGTARWERTLWKKLEVGDIVLLRENDQVPADLVLLNSSDPDGNAFVETKNLDGETNLKVKKCVKATAGIQTEEDVEHARFIIDSEPPHANLYSYNALLKFDQPLDGLSSSSSQVTEPISANELLLRGCALRNTEWIVGIVVFTGKDTKIMLNGGDTPSKRSKIEKETNVNVAVNFVFLLLMCSACAIVGGLLLNSNDNSRNFYEVGAQDSSSNIVNGLIIFGCCLVLFQNIVPISLYISIELTKTISAFFIYQDIDMYYEPLDHPCVPKTWGIVDDLGQIEYIFSDKTGTLTQNVMEFKKCSINGVSYGEGITEAMLGSMKRQGKDISGADPEEQQARLAVLKEQMLAKLNQTFKNRYLQPEKLTLISPNMSNAIASQTEVEQCQNIVTFFRALALCHTALADRTDAGNPFILEYKAQSPDEAALVSAARDVGAVFLNKNNTVIDVEIMGQPERYTPLKILEFNSTRKRMSIIVRDHEGRILLICKGADSVIYQRLRSDHPAELKQTTQRDLEDFANAGLRTLCIAQRYLNEREYLDWSKLYDEAAASLTDRDDAIDEVSEQIEHSLTLLGATALEDKLQVGVPEAIEKLHQAGIKLWILTGDKLQTAIEIGFSCNLLNTDMETMIISADHEQGARAQLEAACNKIAASGRPVIVRGKQRGLFHKSQKNQQQFNGEGMSNDKSQFAVVVDGETLKFCLDKNLKPLFLALTTQCETVVCCRVSPAQKALTVRLVKDGMDSMTLAIGDGANDVSMIQEAHVGVGIAGLEGAQASMSADYAIGQFRFLTKLLLVHGHWNTYRIGVLHQVFFYKNIIWTCALLLFQIFCQGNATYLFDYSLVLLYNLIFTSLPVIMLGSLDQDLRASALMAFPQTYAPGRKGQLYSRSQFWFACLDGVYQSIICFMIPTAAWYWYPIVTASGYSLDPLTSLGSTIGCSCVLSANLYCGLMLKNWSFIIWIVIILSNLFYFVWITVYSAPFFDSTFSSTAYELYGSVQFWGIIVLSVAVSLLPRYTYNAWCSSFRPTAGDLVRQNWVQGNLKEQLGVRSGGKDYQDDNLEAGRSTFALNTYANNQSYEEPTSSDAALHDPSSKVGKRDTLGPQGMRALESSFSFYDPDTLPTSYTPEPNMSAAMEGEDDDEEDESHEDGTFSDYHHDPSSSLPKINIQRASYSSHNPYLQSSIDADQSSAIDSRTALAMNSMDSFENHFNEAFPNSGPTSSPSRQQSSRFQQYQKRSIQNDNDDDDDDEEELPTPTLPFAHSHRQDSDYSIEGSEADGFHTPIGRGSRQASESLPR